MSARTAVSSTSDLTTALYAVYGIYFVCGMAQCFEGVFLPEFRSFFHLSYQQQMYTMFAKNIPFLLAPLIGFRVARIGYLASFIVAVLLFGTGMLLLVPGLAPGRYALVLVAMFIIGVGFNVQLVAGNPLLSALGSAATSSSRLNFASGLGAVAQIVAPAMLIFVIPASAVTLDSRLPWIRGIFTGLAFLLLAITLSMFVYRGLTGNRLHSFEGYTSPPAEQRVRSPLRISGELVVSFAAISLALGTEASLFGFYRNFLEDPAIAGLSPTASQRLFTLYFALFALGRMLAAWLQKKVRPSVHLIVHLVAALLFVGFAVVAKGLPAVALITALGFWVSIFFPTIYALAIRGKGEATGQVSGLLTMGFLGSAVFPIVQGRLADAVGLQLSYGLIFAVYVFLALYAFMEKTRSRRLDEALSPAASLV